MCDAALKSVRIILNFLFQKDEQEFQNFIQFNILQIKK